MRRLMAAALVGGLIGVSLAPLRAQEKDLDTSLPALVDRLGGTLISTSKTWRPW